MAHASDTLVTYNCPKCVANGIPNSTQSIRFTEENYFFVYPPPGTTSLKEAMRLKLQTQEVEYKCEVDKAHGVTIVQETPIVVSAPKVLLVLVSYLRWEREDVHLPDTHLVAEDTCFLPVRHEGGIKEVHYRLRSVVLHSGSAIGGHYIAMVFHDTDAGKVTVYNDQIVKDISVEEARIEMRKRRVTLAVYDRPSAEIPAPPSIAAREGLVIRMTLWNVIREPLVRDICAHTAPHVINMLSTLGSLWSG